MLLSNKNLIIIDKSSATLRIRKKRSKAKEKKHI